MTRKRIARNPGQKSTDRPADAQANPYVPPNAGLDELTRAAKDCQNCDLWKRGTQTVFGEGQPNAKIMFIGEQPGNQEDIEGRPCG